MTRFRNSSAMLACMGDAVVKGSGIFTKYNVEIFAITPTKFQISFAKSRFSA